MHFAALLVASFVASSYAYSVLTPSNATGGWSNQGSQSVTWQRVDTDRLNFTIVLTNQNRALLPSDLVLDALVDGTLLKTTVNPPSGGWPTGSTFRVNFVQDQQDLNAILAQSDEFNIVASTSSAASTSTTSTTQTKTGSTMVVTPTTATTGTGSSSSSTASSTGDSSPPSSGALSVRVPAALVASAGLLAFVLA